MEAIIAKALAEGATIEQVRGEAAEKLKAVRRNRSVLAVLIKCMTWA